MRHIKNGFGLYAGLAGVIACLAGGLCGCHHIARNVKPFVQSPTEDNEGIALSLKALAARAETVCIMDSH